jgi:hypothetical protein
MYIYTQRHLYIYFPEVREGGRNEERTGERKGGKWERTSNDAFDCGIHHLLYQKRHGRKEGRTKEERRKEGRKKE